MQQALNIAHKPYSILRISVETRTIFQKFNVH